MIGALSRHPRPRPARGRVRPAAGAGPPAHRLPRRARLVVARLSRRCPRRCTCLVGLLGLRMPVARAPRRPPLRAGRPLRPAAGRAHPGGVDGPAGPGRGRAAAALGPAGHRDPERDRRSAPPRCCSTTSSRPRSWRRRTRRGWSSCAAATGGCWTGWARTSRRGAGGCVRRARATAITTDGERVTGVDYALRPTERDDIVRGEPARVARLEADAVVSAVPWSALGPLLPEDRRGQEPFAVRRAAHAARPSCPSRCGSTAWSWTG